MVFSEERRMVAECIEEFLNCRIEYFELNDRIKAFGGEFQDETVKVIALDLFPEFYENPSKETWNLCNRLLLVLKSNAELEYKKGTFWQDAYPFESFKDLRCAYSQAEGFRKIKFSNYEQKYKESHNDRADTILTIIFNVSLLLLFFYLLWLFMPKAGESRFVAGSFEDAVMRLSQGCFRCGVIFLVFIVFPVAFLFLNDKLSGRYRLDEIGRDGEEGQTWFVTFK